MTGIPRDISKIDPSPTPSTGHTANPSFVELLTFKMGDQLYAVNILEVREIRGWSTPTTLPHAPEFLRGVINLRGTVLPVIDLSARLNGALIEPTERNVVIVVEVDTQYAGLLVDSVSDIAKIDKSDLQTPPEVRGDPGSGCINSLFIFDDVMVRTLELEPILHGTNQQTH